jgi:hypothetical protein
VVTDAGIVSIVGATEPCVEKLVVVGFESGLSCGLLDVEVGGPSCSRLWLPRAMEGSFSVARGLMWRPSWAALMLVAISLKL